MIFKAALLFVAGALVLSVAAALIDTSIEALVNL
jgi:hypothetical protein